PSFFPSPAPPVKMPAPPTPRQDEDSWEKLLRLHRLRKAAVDKPCMLGKIEADSDQLEELRRVRREAKEGIPLQEAKVASLDDAIASAHATAADQHRPPPGSSPRRPIRVSDRDPPAPAASPRVPRPCVALPPSSRAPESSAVGEPEGDWCDDETEDESEYLSTHPLPSGRQIVLWGTTRSGGVMLRGSGSQRPRKNPGAPIS
ncbi:hypothetical protein KEM55_005023, partial [Ascosphaera atra]